MRKGYDNDDNDDGDVYGAYEPPAERWVSPSEHLEQLEARVVALERKYSSLNFVCGLLWLCGVILVLAVAISISKVFNEFDKLEKQENVRPRIELKR